MKPSLHRRLLLWVAATSIVTFVLALLATTLFVESQLWNQFDNALQDRLGNLTQLVEQHDGTIDFEWSEAGTSVSPVTGPGERLTCWTSDHVVHALPDGSAALQRPQHVGQVESIQCDDASLRLASVQFTPRGEHGEDSQAVTVTLALAVPTAGLDSTITTIRWAMCGALLVGLGLTACGTRLAVNWGLKPLADTAEEIAEHASEDLDFRFQSVQQRPTELQPLLSTLNTLFSRLEAAMQRERAFSSEIAHELRTPLAGLQAKLDVALSKPRSAADLRVTLDECKHIVLQTSLMVESLLATAASARHSGLSQSSNLSSEIEHALIEVGESADKRSLSFHSAIAPATYAMVDEYRLKITLRNVLENAVTYADAGSEICIECSRKAEEAIFRVTNVASEFSADWTDAVFERFWRADASRTQTGTHAGLGLPLTKRIVEQTGGRITAQYEQGRFTLTVWWQAANAVLTE